MILQKIKPTNATPLSIGIIMLGFGVHQVLNASKWKSYVPKVVSDLSPVNNEVIIKAHGTANISLGLLYIFLHKNALVRLSVSAWWFNVMLLCGHHNLKEGLRDFPIFLTTVAYAIKSSNKK